ncbi:hypothetical protein ACFL4O_03855, partial [bacterium]
IQKMPIVKLKEKADKMFDLLKSDKKAITETDIIGDKGKRLHVRLLTKKRGNRRAKMVELGLGDLNVEHLSNIELVELFNMVSEMIDFSYVRDEIIEILEPYFSEEVLEEIKGRFVMLFKDFDKQEMKEGLDLLAYVFNAEELDFFDIDKSPIPHFRGTEGVAKAMELMYGIKDIDGSFNAVTNFIKENVSKVVPSSLAAVLDELDKHAKKQGYDLKYSKVKKVAYFMTEGKTITPSNLALRFINKYRRVLENKRKKDKKITLKTFEDLCEQLIRHEVIKKQAGEEQAFETAGEIQKEFYNIIDKLEWLANLREIKTRKDADKMWKFLDKTSKGFMNMAGIKIDIGDILDVFDNARRAYIQLAVSEGFGGEVVVTLKNITGNELENELKKLGLIENGKLIPHLRVILVNDPLNCSDKKEVKKLEELGKTIQGLNTPVSEIVWVIGEIAFNEAVKNTEQGRVIRGFLDKKTAVPVFQSFDGSIITSAGFISNDLLTIVEQLKEKEGKEDIVIKNLSDVKYVENVEGRLLKVMSRITEIDPQGTAELLKIFEQEKNKDQAVKNLLEKKKADYEKKFGMSIDELNKLFILGWEMLYSSKGMIRMNNFQTYEDVKHTLRLTQKPYGLVDGIPEQAKEILNEPKQKKLIVRIGDEIGTIWRKIIDTETKAEKDIDTKLKPVIEAGSIPGPNTIEKLKYLLARLVGTGVDPVGFDKLVKILTVKRREKNNEREMLMRLAAAA